MLGVTLGDKHSFYDLGLLLKKYPEISPPAPVIKQVEVPGMGGLLDISKVLTGYVLYKRRTIKMEFTIMDERESWPEKHSDIMDALHGMEMDIVLDDDPEYCYTGRLSVSGFDPQKVTSDVVITADVEPFKTRLDATRKSFTVEGEHEATILVSRKPVVPVFTASNAMEMVFNGHTYDLPAGESSFPDVILRSGEKNVIAFTGEGMVTLEYREGRF